MGEEHLQETWAEIYKAPYLAARETKMQAFQFRVIHRVVPCNKFLKNIRIRSSDECSFCPQPDTIQHFLVQCPRTKSFWDNVSEWLDRETGIQLHVSVRTRLFGVPATHPQARVINFLLMFIKFYIYRQKLFHEGAFSTIHLLRELQTRLRVEKYITALDNKQHKFNMWTRLYAALG